VGEMQNLGHHQQHDEAAVCIHSDVAFWLHRVRRGRVDITPPT
jgi:hypothetical protein